MTIKAVQFDKELARIYDETRPIDPEACRTCFRDALQDIVGKRGAKIVDVGCGTGRILECLIPDLFQKEQVIGIDVSPAMIDVAKSKPALHGVEFRNISAVDFAGALENQKHFDAVICHWLFHCLPDWQNVFHSCVSLVKMGGVLAWLEEDSDLYRALDGKNTSNELLKRLFDAYYESVNKELHALGLENITPSSRAGTALRCTDDLANELAVWGWNVQPHFRTHRWIKRVTVNWIVDTVLEHRVFTNLRRIPRAVNHQAIETLKRKLGCDGLPRADHLLELKFWAKPVIATLLVGEPIDESFKRRAARSLNEVTSIHSVYDSTDH